MSKTKWFWCIRFRSSATRLRVSWWVQNISNKSQCLHIQTLLLDCPTLEMKAFQYLFSHSALYTLTYWQHCKIHH